MYDYGLGLVRTSTEVFRKGITERCHGRTVSDVAREYELPYTTIVLDARMDTFCLSSRIGDYGCTSRPYPAMAITSVFPDAKHVLDRFHLVQFFTDALRRRRRFLNETKRHHHIRVIDRSLACRQEMLASEDREVVRSCLLEDPFTQDFYRGLQHIRYVLKATCAGQAHRRLTDWLDRYQFHPCGPLAKIARAIRSREEAMRQTIVSSLSNGKMEGTNNKIKLIKRRGYGYRNLELGR